MGTCPFSHQQTRLHRLEVPVQFEEYRAQRHIHVLVTEARVLEPSSKLTWATRYHTVNRLPSDFLYVRTACCLFLMRAGILWNWSYHVMLGFELGSPGRIASTLNH